MLHQTRLKLLRGHRYALVGQNGAGKTTLMNAIKNEKIDSWPHHLKTAYVDSGSNVDPAFQKQLMLPYLVKTTGKTEEECKAKLKDLDFTDRMMEGTIGAMSGGWQMKHRLVQAVLLDPDIYLLDEPTNHLHHHGKQICLLSLNVSVNISICFTQRNFLIHFHANHTVYSCQVAY